MLFNRNSSLAEKLSGVNTLIETGTGEILHDSKDGSKEKPWESKKPQSLILREVFGMARKADPGVITESALEKLGRCGDHLIFNQCPNHSEEKHLAQADFCRNRLCPMCNWRKSLKMFSQMSEIVEKMTTDHNGLRFIFLTLTVKNPSAADLSATIDAMNEGFKLLVDKSKNLAASKAVKKNILGWFKTLEITYNIKADTYHPHFHVVLAVPDSYFTRGFTTTEKWVKIWRACMKLDYDPVLDVRSVDMAEKGAVCEITKYAVKGEFLSDVCPQEQAVRVVTVLANTLRNRRLIGFGGLFRDVRKFLKQEDVETGDLIRIGDDDPEAKVCKICGTKLLKHMYTWRSGVGKYIC